MPASTEPTVAPAPRYEPFVEAHKVFQAACPCGWRSELLGEDEADTARDNHRTQHFNEVRWPEGREVRWCKRTGRNLDTVEWWKGTIVRHSGLYAVIKVEGYREYQIVSVEDLRKP